MGTDETQPEVQPVTPAPESASVTAVSSTVPVDPQPPASDSGTSETAAGSTPAPQGPAATDADAPAAESPADAPSPESTGTASSSPSESQEVQLAARISGAPAIPGDTPSPAVSPVRVDSRSARDDNDALEGQFCEVVSGPHQGRRGLFESVAVYDPQTGYPTRIVLRTRDAQNEQLSVDYADVRPTPEYSGGR